MIRNYSVQFSCSVVSDSLQPHGLKHARPPLSITNSQSLPKLMSNKSVMPSSHLILCCSLLLLLSIFPSIRAFSNESAFCIRCEIRCASGGQSIGISASASVYIYFLLFTRSINLLYFILLECFDFACGCISTCVYSVILFTLVINLCFYIGFLQFFGGFLVFPFIFDFFYYFLFLLF